MAWPARWCLRTPASCDPRARSWRRSRRIRDVLEAAGDLDLVMDGFDRLLGGTGAVRQRAAYERTGSLEGVVADLVRRTEDSWTDGVG